MPRRYAQQAVTGKTREEVSQEVGDMSWGTFKPLLADATVEHLVSLQMQRSLSFGVFFSPGDMGKDACIGTVHRVGTEFKLTRGCAKKQEQNDSAKRWRTGATQAPLKFSLLQSASASLYAGVTVVVFVLNFFSRALH